MGAETLEEVGRVVSGHVGLACQAGCETENNNLSSRAALLIVCLKRL